MILYLSCLNFFPEFPCQNLLIMEVTAIQQCHRTLDHLLSAFSNIEQLTLPMKGAENNNLTKYDCAKIIAETSK